MPVYATYGCIYGGNPSSPTTDRVMIETRKWNCKFEFSTIQSLESFSVTYPSTGVHVCPAPKAVRRNNVRYDIKEFIEEQTEKGEYPETI